MKSPLVVERESLAFFVALGAVLVFLLWLLFSLTCVRERIVMALAIGSFALAFVKGAAPVMVAPAAILVRAAQLVVWMLILVVSLTLLKSAIGVRGTGHG